LDSEKIKTICDRNLAWLNKHGIHQRAKKISVFHVNDVDFKQK